MVSLPPSDDPEVGPLVAAASGAVHELASGGGSLEHVLSKIASLASAAVDGDVAGVTWRRGTRSWTTLAVTDVLALELDTAQYEAGRGPCLDAANLGRHTRVDDATTDPTWPEFSVAAAARDVRSSVSAPVIARETLGALNVYGRRSAQFDARSETILDAFAAQAAVAGALAEARVHAQQLEAAMESRSVIEQAKGIVMAATGCDADTAFASLIQQSQHENRKLRDIAAELVLRQGRRLH
jgi:GAF domain-containing protein